MSLTVKQISQLMGISECPSDEEARDISLIDNIFDKYYLV